MPLSILRRRLLGGIFGSVITALDPLIARASDVTPEAFQDEVLAIGRQKYPAPAMRPGVGARDIVWGGHHLYLDNIYGEARMLPPEQRSAFILDWLAKFSPEADAKAQAIKEATDHWTHAKPLLRPKFLPAMMAASAKQLLCQAFSPSLVIGYAIDLGDKDLYVTRDKFEKWGVGITDVHATAIANLEALSAAIPLHPRTPDGASGCYLAITTGDGYDAARMLLPAFRSRLLAAVGPSMFGGVPSRDLFMMWSRDFSMRLQAETDLQAYAGGMPHALSAEIFMMDASGVRLASAHDRG